jgi:predicted aldo/keto reductase-like oxidoreductase
MNPVKQKNNLLLSTFTNLKLSKIIEIIGEKEQPIKFLINIRYINNVNLATIMCIFSPVPNSGASIQLNKNVLGVNHFKLDELLYINKDQLFKIVSKDTIQFIGGNQDKNKINFLNFSFYD